MIDVGQQILLMGTGVSTLFISRDTLGEVRDYRNQTTVVRKNKKPSTLLMSVPYHRPECY